MKRRTLVLMGVALAAALGSGAVLAQKVIPAYNTYQSVPFQVGGEGGLAQDLVEYLNANLKGKYTFKLELMPREKFNQTVLATKGFEGVALFLAPPFVGDAEKKKFIWTSPIMGDKNLIISQPDKKVEYTGPESLKGLKFGGVIGNKYAGLESIPRTADTPAELTNLKNLSTKEIDVTLMPESIFAYYLKTGSNARYGLDKLHVSGKPHSAFTRHLFVAPENAQLGKDLEAVAAKMPGDPAWKAILAKYGAK
jgi:polar amino acid transport system substrate-binding protein